MKWLEKARAQCFNNLGPIPSTPIALVGSSVTSIMIVDFRFRKINVTKRLLRREKSSSGGNAKEL